MTVPRGPTRLVLVRSGGYDYAELEIHAPVHLVAENNVGKTTLIAALQFLYIDDVRQMHFSHDWSETRKHYFPKVGSMVLFECMTPTGFQVFGLRGLGPVKGYEYERFVYAGHFDRADFLDGRRVRRWDDDVARRLVGRQLTFLEARNLRASLVGSGEAKGPHLGLVPLKRAANYDSFRFLFRNLLQLSRIEQDQLKRLFIDITRPNLRKVELDLRQDYADLFARVERDSTDVSALRRAASRIEDVVDSFSQRQLLRGRLARLWRDIGASLEAERARTEEARAQIEVDAEATQAENDRLETRRQELARQASGINQVLGARRDERDRLQQLGERVTTFAPELEEGARLQLTKRRDSLMLRISGAKRRDPGEIRRRLADLRRQIGTDRHLIDRYSDAVITWLRAQGIDDEELADIFRLLDFRLLGTVVGDGVKIEDAGAVVRTLQGIAVGFDAEGYRGGGAWLARAALADHDPLGPYQDVATVRARLARAQEDEVDLARVLADIAALAELEREQGDVERELDEAQRRARDWESWQQGAPRLEQLQPEMADLESAANTCAEEQTTLQGEIGAVLVRQHDLKSRAKTINEKFERIKSDINDLKPPPADWVAVETDDGEMDGIRALVDQYRKDQGDHGRLAGRVDKLLGDIEHETGGRYVGGNELETVERLRDEVQALGDRERAVQNLWTSLVDDMRSAFKALLDGVDEIRREVSRLTQALGSRQISNLERVELELVRQRDLLQRLEAVVTAEEMPLFAGTEGRSRAAQHIASWLTDRPRIDLSQLFDLRFKVVDRAGQTKTFDSLRQIESEGTSATIKVLVHLELLKTMLTDEVVSVPFFLDEVAALDPPNLRALIDHATSMGFVPVVASPEARDCVDTLYFLRPGSGNLVLDETSRMVIRRGDADRDA